jgi:hypothetical protein
MKTLILAATAAFLASSPLGLAQTPPAAPPAPPAEAERRPEAPQTPPVSNNDEGAADTGMSRSMHERAARFRVETGNTVIDFRCADGEPTKECADLLVQVLDRLRVDPQEQDDRRDYDRGSDRERDSFRTRSRDDVR